MGKRKREGGGGQELYIEREPRERSCFLTPNVTFMGRH